MKFFLYVQEQELGPYLAQDLLRMFGGISPEALVCPEAEFKPGRAQWRKAALFPELAACVKPEIAEHLVRYSGGSPKPLSLDILSTDDDSNIRALLWNMLTDAGHVVDFAKDGEEVFKRLTAKRYDLVILDVNMPKMNGYKVSELLHDKLPNPPKVIIFTGRDLGKERLQFVCSGADAILNKGTGNDKLLETIEQLFAPKPRPPAPVAAFTPEPPPPGIEALQVREGPAKIQKEGFYEPAAAPPAHSPAPAAENGGNKDALLSQLLIESNALKKSLVDIRQSLGHIELETSQLGTRLEKQVQKYRDENCEALLRTEAQWRQHRNYATLIALCMLAAVLFALVPWR